MSNKVTPHEICKMNKLNDQGFSPQEIADRLDRSLATIQKYLRGKMHDKNVVILEDPSGIFSIGAQFGMLDFLAGYCEQSWPAGIRFGIESNGRYKEATVHYEIVDDRGRKLRTARGGGGYRWVNLES